MKVKVDESLIQTLLKLNIFTTWSYRDALEGKSWLRKFECLTLDTEVEIEGPCAFYGGEVPSQKWECNGGLCSMGAYSYSHSFTPSGLKIGRYSSIAKGLRILDFSHPVDWLSSSVAFFTPEPLVSKSALAEFCDLKGKSLSSKFYRESFDPKGGKPYPTVGNDVWIAENVSLAMGIKIGDGAIIAANSTVTKDVPPYAVVAGSPAVIKRYRFSEEIITRLVKSNWWEFDVFSFEGFDYKNPLAFLEQFELSKTTLIPLNVNSLKIDKKGEINVI